MLFGAGYGVVHLGGGGAGTGGEDEGEQGVETHLLHQRHRLHGLALRLTGEADDHVAGQHQLGHDPAGIGDQVQVFGHIVGAVHGAEHPVAAGLHRQVQLLGHVLAARHGVKQLIAGVLGLGGHEAEEIVSLDLIQLT